MISAFFSRLPVFSWSSCRARMAFLGPVISPLDRWCPSHHGIMAVADLTNLRTLNWCSCDIRPVIRLSFVWRREIHVAFVSVWGICCILELKYLICRLFASFRSTKKRQYLQHVVFTNFPLVFNDVWMVFMDFLMVFSSCVCRILALQTLIWMVFATCWCFKRSRGFI